MATRIDLTKLIAAVNDLVKQVSKYLPVSLTILERHNRAFEELDTIRLRLEEQRELLADYFEESGRQNDKILDRLERVERLEILDRTGNISGREAQRIKETVESEAHQRALQKELRQQVKNLDNAKNRAAKYGIDIPTRLVNEIEAYQERIEAIKQELD